MNLRFDSTPYNFFLFATSRLSWVQRLLVRYSFKYCSFSPPSGFSLGNFLRSFSSFSGHCRDLWAVLMRASHSPNFGAWFSKKLVPVLGQVRQFVSLLFPDAGDRFVAMLVNWFVRIAHRQF